MDILCRAATIKSVKSVVDSWVSIIELHSSKSRHLKAETIQDEMMISVNGAMRDYRGNLRSSLTDGHFSRCSECVQSFVVT